MFTPRGVIPALVTPLTRNQADSVTATAAEEARITVDKVRAEDVDYSCPCAVEQYVRVCNRLAFQDAGTGNLFNVV